MADSRHSGALLLGGHHAQIKVTQDVVYELSGEKVVMPVGSIAQSSLELETEPLAVESFHMIASHCCASVSLR